MKTGTFLDNLQHRIGRLPSNYSRHYRVMQIRVEWPAEGFHRSNSIPPERVKEHFPYQLNSMSQCSTIAGLLGSRDGQFKSVQDGQHIEYDGPMLEAAFLLAPAPDQQVLPPAGSVLPVRRKLP